MFTNPFPYSKLTSEAHVSSCRSKAITLLSIKQNKHHNGTECPPQKRFKAPTPTLDARWGAGTGSKPGGAAQWWVSRHSGHQKGQKALTPSWHGLLTRHNACPIFPDL